MGYTRAVLRTRTPHLTLAAGALLILTGSGGSCSEPARTTTTPVVPEVHEASLGTPDLRLIVLTDLLGTLEPCGCTSRPLGGIDRLAAQLTELRAGPAPTLLVESGDLFFGHGHAPAGLSGAEDQQLYAAELVADLLRDFGVVAAVPGAEDFAHGVATFEAMRARAGFPILGGVALPVPPAPTTAGDTSTPPVAPDPLPTHVVVHAGELSVGIVGITEATILGATNESDAVAAATSAASAARAEGATLVVALVSGERRTARRIAEGATGIDLVVSGGLDEEEAHVPSETDGALVLHAGRQGQGVLVVDIHRGDGGRLRDVSAWTRTAERDRLAEQATDLRARITSWESDPSVSAADVEAQRTRLREIETEMTSVAAAPAVEGPAISARYVELAPELPRDPAVTSRMDAHDVRVNDHNREVFASWLPEPAPEGTPHYVGTETCGGCHSEEIAWWRTTMHGRAYDTLVDQHKEFNLECVGCHVTGWLRPGGATVAHVGPLRDVGCENCHGPGSMHVSSPGSAAVEVHRDMGEDTCLRCHTPEHSDRFVYDVYRRMMIGPGHGMDAAPAEGGH